MGAQIARENDVCDGVVDKRLSMRPVLGKNRNRIGINRLAMSVLVQVLYKLR
jgi:hypothetical protein